MTDTVAPLTGAAGEETEREALFALPVGTPEIRKAAETLRNYKDGKANLEARVVEDERWYQMRHWEVIRRGRESTRPEPSSAWLFNAIMNKHADAMDNYPEPNILPREAQDEADARRLSAVLPVILERCEFEQTYSDNWWEKLKHGTAVYGVFWNNDMENGLGDVDVCQVDLLNIFWEPGITDIQKSRNLFVVNLQDRDLLEERYPQLRQQDMGNAVDIKQYIFDDTVRTDEKVVVVDWYYKLRTPEGRTVLHYAKFVGETLLFASENEPDYEARGWYDHGRYPFVFDTLFPEKGTPVGFGYVALCKDPQLYIDRLGQNILENAMMATRPRYFAATSAGVNEEEFLDWSRPIVHVEGTLDDARLKPVTVNTLSSIYPNILEMKISELKETAANRDMSSGGTTGGVTAASAIAALQEAGNKAARDMIAGSYRRYTQLGYLCIELVRQFYDEMRSFRITGPNGSRYEEVSGQSLREQVVGTAADGSAQTRRPVFDISIQPQKRNPFSRLSQNELAKELYSLGFFNPERAQEAIGALELMEFEGKSKVLRQITEGQTLQNTCRQLSETLAQVTGVAAGGAAAGTPPAEAGAPSGGGQTLAGAAAQAQRATQDNYGETLVRRGMTGGTAG